MCAPVFHESFASNLRCFILVTALQLFSLHKFLPFQTGKFANTSKRAHLAASNISQKFATFELYFEIKIDWFEEIILYIIPKIVAHK